MTGRSKYASNATPASVFVLAVLSLLFWSGTSNPVITKYPNTTYTVHTNTSFNVTCAATGNTLVTVSVQLNVCGRAFVCVATGLNSATWVHTVTDVENCALIRCLASDIDGNSFSTPVTLITEFDAGSTINASCSAICDVVDVSLTKNGTVQFTGFLKPQPNINVVVNVNNYQFTFASDSKQLTLGNLTIQRNASSPYYGSGPPNAAIIPLPGTKLNVNNFIADATLVNITGGSINSVNDILLTGQQIDTTGTTLNANGTIGEGN